MGTTGITCYLAGWMEQNGGVVTRGRVDVWVRTELQVVTIGWSVETEDGAVLSENLHIRISSVQMQQINCRLQTVSDTWHGPGPGHRRDTSQHSLLCAARSMQFTFRCDWKYLLERMGCSQQQQQMEQNQHHSESTACSSPLSPGYVPGNNWTTMSETWIA